MSDHLVGRIAEHALGAGVPRLNDAVGRHRDDAVGRGGDDRRELRVAFGFLEVLGDVRVGAEPADDVAGVVAYRHGARQEPAIDAVAALQRESVLPHLTCRQAAVDLLHDAVGVIGMLQRRPAPLLGLVERQPRVVEPALVVPVDVARLVGHPGERGDVVGQRAEARFALALRTLGVHPRRRIDDDGEHAGRLAGVVAHRAVVEVGPHVLGDAAPLQAEMLVAERHAIHRREPSPRRGD